MGATLRTRIAARLGSTRRAVALGAAVLLAGGLAVAVTQAAGAQPQPSIDQVRATINTLTGEFNKANQQYDQVEEQLGAANARLKQVNKQMAGDQARYEAARKLVVQVADSSYEDSSSMSLAGLLTSNDPSQVLAEASIVLQITGTRNLQSQAFFADASQFAAVQQEQQHTQQGIAQLAGQRKTTKDHISSLLAKQNSILNSLTGAQLTAVEQGTVNGGGGTTHSTYTGPTGVAGGYRRGLRLQAARLPLQLRLNRTVRRRLRLLRPDDGGLGGGGHHDPAGYLQPVGGAAAHLRVRDPARRPAVLQRDRPRRDVRRRRHDHRRAIGGPAGPRAQHEYRLVRGQLRRRCKTLARQAMPPAAGPGNNA